MIHFLTLSTLYVLKHLTSLIELSNIFTCQYENIGATLATVELDKTRIH